MAQTGFLLYQLGVLTFFLQFFFSSKLNYIPFALLIGMNSILSFYWIWKQEKKRILILGLNLFQLILFTTLFRQIYLLEGPEHYTFASPPEIFDWFQLTMVHLLRAMDFMDAIEAYGWQLQSVKSKGYLSGTPIVLFHLLVDFVLITTLFQFFATYFSKPIFKKANKLGRRFLNLLAIGTGIFLSWKIQEGYLFLLWGFICLGMLYAIWFWNRKFIQDLGETLRLPQLMEQLPSSIAIPANMTLFILFAFIPLILFTLLFGAVTYLIYLKFPFWFTEENNFFLVPVDHLFRAIDLLDVAQIYEWNLSGGTYNSGIFGTVVVTYRFLVSLYFYEWLYRLILIFKIQSILPFEKLLEGLKSSDLEMRLEVLRILRENPKPDIIPHILPLLCNEEQELREEGTLTLKEFKTEHLLPAIISFLREDPKAESYQAVTELIIRVKDKELTLKLLAILTPKEDKLLIQAFSILGDFKAKEAIPNIVRLLSEREEHIQIQALEALKKIEATETTKEILPLLTDSNSKVRQQALETLLSFKAPELKTHFSTLLKDFSKEVRIQALTIAEVFQLKEHILEIQSHLNEAEPDFMIKALITLGKLNATEAQERIVQELQNSNPQVRSAASESLGYMGEQAKGTLLALFPLLKDKNTNVQQKTIQTLWQIGDRSAIAPLEELLEESLDEELIEEILEALVRLDASEVLPYLTPYLESNNLNQVRKAIKAIGFLGDIAGIPYLEPFLKDKRISLLHEAEKALAEIQKKTQEKKKN